MTCESGSSCFGCEDDDRAGAVGVDHVQVGQVDGAAGAADDVGVAGVGDAAADRVLHLHLVLVGPG